MFVLAIIYDKWDYKISIFLIINRDNVYKENKYCKSMVFSTYFN